MLRHEIFTLRGLRRGLATAPVRPMRRLALASLALAAAHTGGAQIVSTQSTAAVTLATVPEPGSTAIFVFALAVLGLARVARLRDRA